MILYVTYINKDSIDVVGERVTLERREVRPKVVRYSSGRIVGGMR